MKRLTFNTAHNLDLLHDELIGGIPNFRRTIKDASGIDINTEDSGSVRSRLGKVEITFADDIEDSAVRAIMVAHNHTTPQVNLRTIRLAGIDALRTIGKENWTDGEFKELVSLLAEELCQ